MSAVEIIMAIIRSYKLSRLPPTLENTTLQISIFRKGIQLIFEYHFYYLYRPNNFIANSNFSSFFRETSYTDVICKKMPNKSVVGRLRIINLQVLSNRSFRIR